MGDRELRPEGDAHLAAMRQEYTRGGLRRADLAAEPAAQLLAWLDEAIATASPEPTAAVLATAAGDGTPSARTVLVKGCDDRGLAFFTNYESRKARELTANPRACLTFFWPLLQRQAIFVGAVERVPRAESEAYFAGRPRASRLGAWASPQSEVLADRAALEERLRQVEERFADGEVPCPPWWGGYRLAPAEAQFWQGRASRLHDRFRYRRPGDGTGGWQIDRLAP